MKSLKELFEDFLAGNLQAEAFKTEVQNLAGQDPEKMIKETAQLLEEYQKVIPALQSLFLGLATQNWQDTQNLEIWFKNWKVNSNR